MRVGVYVRFYAARASPTRIAVSANCSNMFGRASMAEEEEDEVVVPSLSSTASAALFNRESRLFASHLFLGGVDRLVGLSVATDSSLLELVVVDAGEGDLDTKALSLGS